MKNVVRSRTIPVMPAKAGIQYAVKPRANRKHLGILDHPPSRMMTVELTRQRMATSE
jgi:hypothetical protein